MHLDSRSSRTLSRGPKRPLAGTLAPLVAALALSSPGGPAGALEVPPGSELRPRPRWDAPVRAVLAGGDHPLLAVGLAGWVQVETPAGSGWLERGDPAGWPDTTATALARARRALGAAAAEPRQLGPFAAASDLDPGRTWRFFDRLAAQVPEAYAERYGLAAELPAGSQAETVILFARQEDYRRAAGGGEHGGGQNRAGQAGEGFALLYVGDRGRAETGTTLVHELTHLLNRRALGGELPVWLDEGLAEDMALLRIGSGGRLTGERLDARSVRTSAGKRLYGPLLHLPRLAAQAAAGELPEWRQLAALDRARFESAPERGSLYALFGFWVRYLLEDEALAPAFHRYLATHAENTAQGPPAALATALGRSDADLDRGFRRWLLDLPRRLGLEPAAQGDHAGSW